MPTPFFIRRSPIHNPKMGQGQTPVNPAQQKTSTFGYLFRRPPTTPGLVKKIIAKNKPGFLEGGAFRKHDELIHEVRKGSYYKSIPTYSKKFTQAERMSLVKELERAGRGSAGLTREKLGWAIKKLEKIKREAKSHIRFHSDSEKVKTLDQKIKQAQVWKKTWDRPKI